MAERNLKADPAGRPAYNFGAGPAMLPAEVMLELREELLDYRGTRQSVMEMGHRTPVFEPIATHTEADLRSLMGIPADYLVLFLQGGAATQFGMLPVNLAPNGAANYVVTGHWSNRAWQEGQKLCRANLAMDAKDSGYTDIPAVSSWKIDEQGAYLHYTVNETIGGVEFQSLPDVGDMPLAADMTSMILSRPVDVNRFALIYAAAQKNLGIAGLTIVIARRDALKAPLAGIPTMLDYRAHAEQHSMLNTPSVYAWYVCGKMLQWIKRQGGAEAMALRNKRKADLLYKRVDRGGFYVNKISKSVRSIMNVPFNIKDKALEPMFLEEAGAADLINLKGHRFAGGMRASLYNAMPEEGVQALVDFMDDFERRHG
ncbi:MAG TPA: 3-phosphoserine/phosphohydroxythreonine transaminase [Gammaproteobacteria bacterium]|nr:3-phosphoserine/phosphohydroxythreonine transaminase [Gammaproteobacteria bacterium]